MVDRIRVTAFQEVRKGFLASIKDLLDLIRPPFMFLYPVRRSLPKAVV